MIFGGVDGAGQSHGAIIALGIANILTNGFSMAAGNFAGTRAMLDDRKRVIAVEEWHVKDHCDSELEVLLQILN